MHAQAPSATASCVPVPAMLAKQPVAEAAQGTAHSPEHHYNSYKKPGLLHESYYSL